MSRSGWFPFCLPAGSDVWDGTGFPGPAEVGPGTFYPLGVSLETAMRWYWQVKTWHVASDAVLSGTQSEAPFAFSLSLAAAADIPVADTPQALVCPSGLSYNVDPVLLTLYTPTVPLLTWGGLYYPCLRLRLQLASQLTLSSYKGDAVHPKAWPQPALFDGQDLALWYDEASDYDGTGGAPGDSGPWTQSRDGTATVTASVLF